MVYRFSDVEKVASAVKESFTLANVTMEFDPQAREWRAYDGGLVRWMKQELIPRTP